MWQLRVLALTTTLSYLAGPFYATTAKEEKLLKLTRRLYWYAIHYPLSFHDLEILQKIANQVRALQRPKSAWAVPEKDRPAKMPILAAWAQKALKFDGFDFRESPGANFGMFATRELPANHIVMKSQLNHTLSKSDSQPMLRYCMKEERVLAMKGRYEDYWNSHIWVIMRLIMERLNPNSFFKPYIDSLPYDFAHPVTFGPTESALLAGSQVYPDSVWTAEEVYIQYAVVYEQLVENEASCAHLGLTPDTVTLDLFQWAFSIVITRVFQDPGGDDMRLLPVRDLVNHQFGAKMEHMSMTGSSPESSFTMAMTKKMKKGEELLLEYKDDTLTMDKFFNSWGMVMSNTPSYITCKLFPVDPDYDRKRVALENNGFAMDASLAMYPQKSPMPLSLNDYNFLVAIATGLISAEDLDETTWRQTWLFLSDQIEFQLQWYTRSLTENRAFREKNANTLSPNALLALEYIMTEQAALERGLSKIRKLGEGPIMNFHNSEKEEL